MPTQHVRLDARDARAGLVPISEDLGAIDRARLRKLAELIGRDDRRIRLNAALKSPFPVLETDEKAPAALRNLQRRVKPAAAKAGTSFALRADTKKKNLPRDRACWFEGADESVARSTEFSRATTENPTPNEPVEAEA